MRINESNLFIQALQPTQPAVRPEKPADPPAQRQNHSVGRPSPAPRRAQSAYQAGYTRRRPPRSLTVRGAFIDAYA